MDIFTIACISSVFVLAIWLFSKWSFSYWKKVGLEYPQPEFLFGNTKGFLTRKLSFGDQMKVIYDELKSRGLKHGGFYMSFRPSYLPIDLDLIKTIMQKDFNHFVNHGLYFNEKSDPLSGHLFNLEDEKWRNLRARLTPTFTSGKIKMMFQTLVSCTSGLGNILTDHSIIGDAIDIKDVVSRFTTDVIGSVAFGIECNSLKDPDSEFRHWGKRIFTFDFMRRIKNNITMLIPRDIVIKTGIKLMSRDLEDFFMNVVRSTVQFRETHDVHRKDFMHLLLQLKNKGQIAEDDSTDKEIEIKAPGQLLTFNEIAAQCFVFFLAGFETSATTMTFALLELALNQDVQKKLREEINTVLDASDGEVTYEAIMKMSYLDKVVHETLRKHSPVPGTPRVCNKAYKVPGTDIVLEVGTRVHIPFQAIHWDPEYYPEPQKFDPERFSEENKSKRHPFAFLPFGEGPRICIGARFGLLQVKVGLTAIIRNFKVTLNEKTKTPIKYATNVFITSVDGDVWLNVEKIQ
ncbi:cytochrome P450 6-like isoform X1 [Leptinotarsa decemlineata]|uniref:cytochrome P450 6-like isoform X1 n=1 Tax=Leptinotarsa decemlineata TaxID=7539 RepID=UPI003D309AB2